MTQFIEMLTPALTVMQFLDDLPIKTGKAAFGVRAAFEKEGFLSFNSRLQQHVRYRFGEKQGAYGDQRMSTPLETDDLTNVRCAWFIAPDQPLVVDTALVRVPTSVRLTRGSRVHISFLVHKIGANALGFLPRAIQILSSKPPSDPAIPFNRLDHGYRYEPMP